MGFCDVAMRSFRPEKGAKAARAQMLDRADGVKRPLVEYG
jgi:hypothetical protein